MSPRLTDNVAGALCAGTAYLDPPAGSKLIRTKQTGRAAPPSGVCRYHRASGGGQQIGDHVAIDRARDGLVEECRGVVGEARIKIGMCHDGRADDDLAAGIELAVVAFLFIATNPRR